MLGSRMRGLRPPGKEVPTTTDSSAPSGASASTPSSEPLVSPLFAIRQGLAATAEVSRELLRDLREVNQEVANEVRQSVGEIRTSAAAVFQELSAVTAGQTNQKQEKHEVAAAPAESSDLDELDSAEALDAQLEGEGRPAGSSDIEDTRTLPERRYDEQAQSAAERMKSMAQLSKEVSKKLWRKTASFRQRGLRQTAGTQGPDLGEVFWALPSSRGNYVLLTLEDSTSGLSSSKPVLAGTAVQHVRRLGGSLAQKGREVINKARDLGQKLEQASASPSVMRRPPAASSASGHPEAYDGDSIFEIGSDGDAAWSDGEAPGEMSDGATSETRSTRSASASVAAKGISGTNSDHDGGGEPHGTNEVQSEG